MVLQARCTVPRRRIYPITATMILIVALVIATAVRNTITGTIAIETTIDTIIEIADITTVTVIAMMTIVAATIAMMTTITAESEVVEIGVEIGRTDLARRVRWIAAARVDDGNTTIESGVPAIAGTTPETATTILKNMIGLGNEAGAGAGAVVEAKKRAADERRARGETEAEIALMTFRRS
jgi:hypothetical protein